MTDISKLRSLFGSYANAKNYASAFSDMLDLFMLPFKIVDTAEERQVRLRAITDHPQKDEVVSLLTELGECAEGFHDPLGELYMQELYKGHNGQYFTPEHICDLMAMLTIGNHENGKTVLDPACGSGRMLLAAAKINRNQVFYGADVDAVCCKMAVANMLLQSLTGEIAHMNSLTNEFFTGYRIGTMLYNGYHHPWFREFSNPEESRIWLRPVQKNEQPFPGQATVFPTGNFQQGTLF
jgi:type I restriction-modification system DNA methylase subunit